MVRVTAVLARIPAIKFRKGGLGTSTNTSTAAPAGANASAQAQVHHSQPTASMSTGTISDFELPARYQRRPLSQEEIDHINGGGINEPSKTPEPKPPYTLGVIKIPHSVLVEAGKKEKQIMSLNIVLQKSEKKWE